MKRRGPAAALLAIAWLGVAAAAEDSTPAPKAAPPPDPGPIPSLPAPKAPHARLLDVAAAGPRLVVVGEQGVILASDDGAAWSQAASPTSVMLTRVRFLDDQHGFALGYDATVLETVDGGRAWTVRHRDPAGRALYDLLFVDATHAIAVGAYGTHLVSDDGGRTWTAPATSVLADAGLHVNALVRLADATLLAVGERGLLARSADQGATWQLLDSPYGGSLFGALPRGDKGAIVFGMRGHAFEAADVRACPTIAPESFDPYARENLEEAAKVAALGWRRIPGPSQESLFGALPAPDGTVAIVGANGAVLKLDAEAQALKPLDLGTGGETLVRLADFDGRTFAVGAHGVREIQAP